MKRSIEWLLTQIKENDAKFVYVHFSGLGSADEKMDIGQPDEDDESWVPVDFKKNGVFSSKNLRELFLDKIQNNITCMIVSDTSHTGSLSDQNFTYNSSSKEWTSSKNKKYNHFNLIQISGAVEKKNLTEVLLNGRINGVLTHCVGHFLLKENTLREFIEKSNEMCRKRYLTQVPLLSCNKRELAEYIL